MRGNPRRLDRELPASRGRLEGGAQGGETFSGRAHSSGLYMGPTWSLWEAKCPRVLPATLWPPYPSLEPRRVGGAVTATGLAGHKGVLAW